MNELHSEIREKAKSESAVTETADASIQQGKVKWYSLAKGYGFLEGEAGGEDIFFHHSEIVGGDDFLPDGAQVSFEVIDGPRGSQARQVTVLVE